MKILPFRKKIESRIDLDYVEILSKDPGSQESLRKLHRALLKAKQDLEKMVDLRFKEIKSTSNPKTKELKLVDK